jgi:hypothetical protein
MVFLQNEMSKAIKKCAGDFFPLKPRRCYMYMQTTLLASMGVRPALGEYGCQTVKKKLHLYLRSFPDECASGMALEWPAH